MEFEKQWQHKFSEAAKKGGQDYEISHWSKDGLEAYEQYFLKYFRAYMTKDNLGAPLLDVGCGPGTFSKIAAEKGFKVSGVDYSEEMIQLAKQKTAGTAIDFKVADIYDLPFDNGYFAYVICLGVFQVLEKPQDAAREIQRVLKQDGVVIITALNIFSFYSLFSKKGDLNSRRYNPYQLKAIFESENFEVKLKGIYFFPAPFQFLTNAILQWNIYSLFNALFPIFMWFSHSFYLEIKKR